MRAYFNIEQEDARLYHIVLNTERLSIEARVKTVCELAESPRFQDTAAIRSTLANKLVEAEISSALVDQISVIAAPLGVSVSVADGKVTLAGTTSSGSVRRRAEKIAHEVASVYQIDNHIISVPSHGSGF
jgi:osmotically-inducible protein OsmY